jgi:hypothetical protein
LERTLADIVAQAVIDKIEERDRITRLADMVVERVIAIQAEQSAAYEPAGETITRQ